MKNTRRFFSYIGERKTKYFMILAATLILSAFIEVLYSYTYKVMFNAIEYSNKDKFIIGCVLCFAVLVLNYFAPYMRYFQMKQVRGIVFDIKINMFRKLTNLNMQYFEEHHSADVLKRLNYDADSLKDTYFTRVFRVLVLSFDGAVSIIMMIVYNWKLAIISILFSGISVLISIGMNKIIDRLSHDIQDKIVRLTERLSDVLSGFLIIKMYAGGRLITDDYFNENNGVRKNMLKRTRVLSLLEMLTFLTGMLGSFGTIIAGVFFVINGELDYGTVMAVVTLQMGVSGMFQNLGGAMANYVASIAEAQRVFDFIELEDVENEDSPKEYLTMFPDQGISIENVTFAYKDRKSVLDNFKMNVANGEKIMVVGESGCGKSTLLKLLMRFYDKTSGSIRIFGHEIEEYSLNQLHEMITYVPQENYLFAGTIRENIIYGNPFADEEAVDNAAQMAFAKEFIDSFPEGFDTVMTAGGKNLSGGQRQRIAIARAFLKNSPILLMDEPSAALDVESEKKINLAMKQLMKNKIVIMVTHRTTSFQEFDRMVNI